MKAIAVALVLFLLVLAGSSVWNDFRHYPVPRPQVVIITCHDTTACPPAATGG